MAYDGPTDCPDEDCLEPLVFDDFVCADGTINEAWLNRLNDRLELLAESICCVSQSSQIQLLTEPEEIYSLTLDSSGGTSEEVDTGVVTLDLDTLVLAGVGSVPTNAKGVIVRCQTAVNGNQTDPGVSNSASHAILAVEGDLASVNAFSKSKENVQSYVDTNLGAGDNDDINTSIVSASSLPDLKYRAIGLFDESSVEIDDTIIIRLHLVGFV